MNQNLQLKRTARKIKKELKKCVKKSRYEHSIRVAKMCVQICKMNGLNKNKGYLIGVAHDLCKQLPDDQMIQLACKDGLPVSDYEKRNTFMLHGRCAAVRMKEDYGIDDSQLLEAVSVHTCGKIGMNDYSKVLLISDKAEPGRSFSTKEYRAELFALPLDKMFLRVIKESHEYVVAKGYEIFPESQQVVDFYVKEGNENE